MLFDTLRAYTLRYVTAIFETPLQLFVFLAGAWFTANGVIAFGIYPDMAFGGAMHSCTIRFLGFIPVTVNGWHALFHLISGLAGLVMATRRPRAELYTLIFAPYYLLVAALGFMRRRPRSASDRGRHLRQCRPHHRGLGADGCRSSGRPAPA